MAPVKFRGFFVPTYINPSFRVNRLNLPTYRAVIDPFIANAAIIIQINVHKGHKSGNTGPGIRVEIPEKMAKIKR